MHKYVAAAFSIAIAIEPVAGHAGGVSVGTSANVGGVGGTASVGTSGASVGASGGGTASVGTSKGSTGASVGASGGGTASVGTTGASVGASGGGTASVGTRRDQPAQAWEPAAQAAGCQLAVGALSRPPLAQQASALGPPLRATLLPRRPALPRLTALDNPSRCPRSSCPVGAIAHRRRPPLTGYPAPRLQLFAPALPLWGRPPPHLAS